MIIKYVIRFLITLCWIGLIYGFVMLPYFLNKSDERSLRIYTWANRIDESILQDFENRTGIKIYLNYYESAEELLTKLEVMPLLDCDLMLPSDHILDRMILTGLVKKIDVTRCPFIENIDSQFLSAVYKNNDLYAIPMYWDVFGIGYNALKVSSSSVDLNLLFNKNDIVGSEVGMTDEPREAIFLAAQYLNHDLNNLGLYELKSIRRLLKEQKSWVGAYSDSQQGYFLASDTFNVAASDREIICRQSLINSHIKFALLKKGSMLRVDSMVINATSKKDDLIYEFLNFLFSDKILMIHAQKFCILPTMTELCKQLDQTVTGVANLYPGSAVFNTFIRFKLPLTQKEINDFWIRFKAS